MSLHLNKVCQFAEQSVNEAISEYQSAKTHLEVIQKAFEEYNKMYMGSDPQIHISQHQKNIFFAEHQIRMCCERRRLAELAFSTCQKAYASSLSNPTQTDYLELMTSTCAESALYHKSLGHLTFARQAWIEACNYVNLWA